MEYSKTGVPKKVNSHSRSLSFRITLEEYDFLKECVTKDNLYTLSNLMRLLITSYIETRKELESNENRKEN